MKTRVLSTKTEHRDPADERLVRDQLARVLASSGFARSQNRRAFLTYVVTEALEGRAQYLKGVTIAMAVFDRDEDFDQQADPVVRLEARRLRHALEAYYAEEGLEDPVRISIPKGGYVPSFELRATDPTPQAPTVPAPSGPSAQGVSRAPSWRTLVAGVGGLLALGLGMWALLGGTHAAPLFGTRVSAIAESRPQGPKLAVLPFTTLSADPERVFLAIGLTEEIRTELTRFQDLWVMYMGNAVTSGNSAGEAIEYARDIGAGYALEGSVRETDEGLRLNARLIDLTQNRYIWSDSFSGATDPAAIYALQDQVTAAVVSGVAGKYGAVAMSELAARPARTAPKFRSSYECVLRYYAYQVSIDLARHGQIKACLERAVKTSPAYAEAWAVLSNVYLQELRFGIGTPDLQQVMDRALEAANRAIELAPFTATGHLMLSNLYFIKGDMAAFRASGTEALDLNPHDGTVLAHFGLRLALSGHWQEGRALLAKARALNPLHPHWYHFSEVFYHFSEKDFETALGVLAKIDMPGFFWVPLWQAVLYAHLDRPGEAQVAARALRQMQPDIIANLNEVLQAWQMEAELAAGITEGLRKAGLWESVKAPLLAKRNAG